MLPFALRWITKEWDEKQAGELLDVLIKKKAIQAYPVLIEVNEQKVAQAEHTFIPLENGVTVTTKDPWTPWSKLSEEVRPCPKCGGFMFKEQGETAYHGFAQLVI